MRPRSLRQLLWPSGKRRRLSRRFAVDWAQRLDQLIDDQAMSRASAEGWSSLVREVYFESVQLDAKDFCVAHWF